MGVSQTGCPADLVWCMLLYAICLARSTPAGRVDLVADLRVGLLLLSRAAAGQQDNLGCPPLLVGIQDVMDGKVSRTTCLGNIVFIGWNGAALHVPRVYPMSKTGLPIFPNGSTRFSLRVYLIPVKCAFLISVNGCSVREAAYRSFQNLFGFYFKFI